MRTMDLFADVGEFHVKFSLPVFDPKQPHKASRRDDAIQEIIAYRRGFLREELSEFERAAENGDAAEMLDALVDLVWVALGTAHYLNLPFYHGWAEVKRANLSKELRREDDPLGKRGAVEKIKKPEGWEPPDHATVLALHDHRAERLRQAALNAALSTNINEGDDHADL